MSCIEAFSYALLLKGADRAEKILDLLNHPIREEVKSALEGLNGMPPEAIRRLWRERRKADELAITAGT
jgi:hypothetical protein